MIFGLHINVLGRSIICSRKLEQPVHVVAYKCPLGTVISFAIESIYRAKLSVRFLQVIVSQVQVLAQNANIGMSHQAGQPKNVHAIAQTPDGKGATKSMGRTVLDAGDSSQPLEYLPQT